MRYLILLTALLTIGCGSVWSPVEPGGTDQETHALAETERFAKLLNVKVHGELSDTVYAPAPGEIAGAWYDRGVVYFYRPWIVKQDLPFITDIAAHEVCHAKHFFHDLAHWECNARLANPTYPRP